MAAPSLRTPETRVTTTPRGRSAAGPEEREEPREREGALLGNSFGAAARAWGETSAAPPPGGVKVVAVVLLRSSAEVQPHESEGTGERRVQK